MHILLSKNKIFSFFLFLFLLESLSNLTGASGPIYIDPQKTVREADIVLIAQVEKVEDISGDCWHNENIKFTPVEFLKGNLHQDDKVAEYHVGFPMLYDKNGPIKNCPEGVHWFQPPYAKEISKNKLILLTLKKESSSETYNVTASFDMTEKEKIIGWMR